MERRQVDPNPRCGKRRRTKVSIFSKSQVLLSVSPQIKTNQKVHLLPEGLTYGRSLPPVTMSPSRRVVYMVKTGPV